MIWESHARTITLGRADRDRGSALAGCSSERFSDNHYDNRYNDNRYVARPAPQPEPMGAAAMPPSSRIEQAPVAAANRYAWTWAGVWSDARPMPGPMPGGWSVGPMAGVFAPGGYWRRQRQIVSRHHRFLPRSPARRRCESPRARGPGKAAPRSSSRRARPSTSSRSVTTCRPPRSSRPTACTGRCHSAGPAAGDSTLHWWCTCCCTAANREQRRTASVSRARVRNRASAACGRHRLVRPARGWAGDTLSQALAPLRPLGRRDRQGQQHRAACDAQDRRSHRHPWRNDSAAQAGAAARSAQPRSRWGSAEGCRPPVQKQQPVSQKATAARGADSAAAGRCSRPHRDAATPTPVP